MAKSAGKFAATRPSVATCITAMAARSVPAKRKNAPASDTLEKRIAELTEQFNKEREALGSQFQALLAQFKELEQRVNEEHAVSSSKKQRSATPSLSPELTARLKSFKEEFVRCFFD